MGGGGDRDGLALVFGFGPDPGIEAFPFGFVGFSFWGEANRGQGRIGPTWAVRGGPLWLGRSSSSSSSSRSSIVVVVVV